MSHREVMQQALETLKSAAIFVDSFRGQKATQDAITALKAALEQQAEPVAWNKSIRDSVDSLLEQAGYQPDSSARHQLAMMNFDATPSQRKPFDLLVITTAYEQGVGKGHQAHRRSAEIENPYAPGECQQAWALGYDEGKEQPASKAAHGIKEGT